MDLSFILNHLGEDRESLFGAVAPPVIRTSNFRFSTVEEMHANINREFEVPFYSRGNNPTLGILRKKIAALEKTEDAIITSSGCAAITTAVISQLSAGDHVLCIDNCYSWAHTLFSRILSRFGIETTFADCSNTEAFLSHTRSNTRLIYLESPSSLSLELQDLGAIARYAQAHNIITICDNSYASPIYQNPAGMGIDIVLHSASKYLGGHSDLIAGVICGKNKLIRKIFDTELMTFGGIATPDNAWLILRGLRTLPLRMKQSSNTAAEVVSFLENHPGVEFVRWPFSPAHPQYHLAKKQMTACGGLFSFCLKTNDTVVVSKFCNSLQRFLLACSWGGHESLVLPVFILGEEGKNPVPPGLIRIYAGLEEPEVLINDLSQALHRCGLI